MSIGWILLLRVDRSELKVHSDRTRFLRSGNDARIYKNYNVYLPLNKTMSYNGQESGSLETSSALADKKSPMKMFLFSIYLLRGPLHQGICRFGRLRRRIGMKNRKRTSTNVQFPISQS